MVPEGTDLVLYRVYRYLIFRGKHKCTLIFTGLNPTLTVLEKVLNIYSARYVSTCRVSADFMN